MSENGVDDLNNNNENLNNNDQEIDPTTGQPRARNEQGTSPHVPRRIRRDHNPNDEDDDAQTRIRVTGSELTRIFIMLEK
ncbi:hypothetical protein K7X08_006252 [Anisodus acutangulus]|uniref:Uncharacterized protein n=1 Tax=Anisodus acutangulus TaxID=402998 RepID=A0A9Q1MYH8_9SOLA|nr:hypothetical protein K7X08_006252 [Anisodus acutangulus]